MPPPERKHVTRPKPAGFAAREAVAACLVSILDRGRPLDDAFEAAVAKAGPLEARDRAFARLVVMTVLRRKGELEAVVSSFLEKPLPADAGRLWPILLSASAQLLMLETPPHAAISLAVDQCRADPKARRFDRLTNAVLRRVSATRREVLARLDPVTVNLPSWLLRRWTDAYGDAQAHEIAAASLGEAALDLSVKQDAETWAERLGGVLLPTGSIRIARANAGRVEELPGFAEGAWWVQDAAAALPARLLGLVAGLSVADLCAAPGGKTAELAAAGAKVTAVDQSPARLARLRENLARLKLDAEVVEADVLAWEPGRTFDAVLLDAPCSATGTIRRHPDILHLRRKDDTSERTALQRRLLDRAARLVAPGGRLVYCTCSLEPEEGEAQIARFLDEQPGFVRATVAPGEAGIDAAWITPEGDLRTLPSHLARPEPELSGMDGFYVARLQRREGAEATAVSAP
ncbi:transcription antitermination factor NusB [Hyphomicrobium sp.]|uniref:RsmB/NOP family class I SAM-dependent RNA methyltransferase n=1 Tax=Hyphomicrobium sp. TaxID=82 RepID=UPI0025BA82BD|nr:transcription antitermination factor NusB [Hyphomicrobium sp.]MCC7252762.1 methyltransferase domain-containing protein [Hyphomicrobium sp.]